MVAIKDMEMPQGCRKCQLLFRDWYCCLAGIDIWEEYLKNEGDFNFHLQRLPNCPLVEMKGD